MKNDIKYTTDDFYITIKPLSEILMEAGIDYLCEDLNNIVYHNSTLSNLITVEDWPIFIENDPTLKQRYQYVLGLTFPSMSATPSSFNDFCDDLDAAWKSVHIYMHFEFISTIDADMVETAINNQGCTIYHDLPNHHCLICNSSLNDFASTTLTHEIGHALKLSHTRETSNTSSYKSTFMGIMQPVNPGVDGNIYLYSQYYISAWYITNYDKSALIAKWGK